MFRKISFRTFGVLYLISAGLIFVGALSKLEGWAYARTWLVLAGALNLLLIVLLIIKVVQARQT